MAPSVPGIEVADHRNALRVRSPNGEANAGDILHFDRLGTQRPRQIIMRSLSDQMEVQFAEEQTKRIGILRFLDRIGPVDLEPVGAVAADIGGKETAFEYLLHPRNHSV